MLNLGEAAFVGAETVARPSHLNGRAGGEPWPGTSVTSPAGRHLAAAADPVAFGHVPDDVPDLHGCEADVFEVDSSEMDACDLDDDESFDESVALALVGESLLSGDESDWHERALCAQTDPEAFFPEKGGSTREAKKICTGCEVRAECLSYALANDERFGIWGGLSERERRRIKRRVS